MVEFCIFIIFLVIDVQAIWSQKMIESMLLELDADVKIHYSLIILNQGVDPSTFFREVELLIIKKI